MTNIYFVRHAEPNYENHDDLRRELTEKGKADRIQVFNLLQDKAIDLAFSSPYHRSIDTIKPFTEAMNIPITIIDDFRERKIDSEWIPDFDSFCRKQWSDFSYKLKNGESLREVQNRNIKALQVVLDEYPDHNIIIGSHGTAMSTIYQYYDSRFGVEDFFRIKRKMPWFVHLEFEQDQFIRIEELDCEMHRS